MSYSCSFDRFYLIYFFFTVHLVAQSCDEFIIALKCLKVWFSNIILTITFFILLLRLASFLFVHLPLTSFLRSFISCFSDFLSFSHSLCFLRRSISLAYLETLSYVFWKANDCWDKNEDKIICSYRKREQLSNTFFEVSHQSSSSFAAHLNYFFNKTQKYKILHSLAFFSCQMLFSIDCEKLKSAKKFMKFCLKHVILNKNFMY